MNKKLAGTKNGVLQSNLTHIRMNQHIGMLHYGKDVIYIDFSNLCSEIQGRS